VESFDNTEDGVIVEVADRNDPFLLRSMMLVIFPAHPLAERADPHAAPGFTRWG
jgi:hypothetical protein